MQTIFETKQPLDRQIKFIQDAKNLVADPKQQVIHDIDSFDMLRAIQESLEDLRYLQNKKSFGHLTHPNPYLKWVLLQANAVYFEALRKLDVIVDTESFTEYKHKEKQIYLRHSKAINFDEVCSMYIEPMVNMNRTIRMQKTCIKIQLSMVPYINNSRFSEPVATKMSTDNLFEYLRVCESWEDNFMMCLMDEPELDFSRKEVGHE